MTVPIQAQQFPKSIAHYVRHVESDTVYEWVVIGPEGRTGVTPLMFSNREDAQTAADRCNEQAYADLEAEAARRPPTRRGFNAPDHPDYDVIRVSATYHLTSMLDAEAKLDVTRLWLNAQATDERGDTFVVGNIKIAGDITVDLSWDEVVRVPQGVADYRRSNPDWHQDW